MNLTCGLTWIVHILACGWYLCAALHDVPADTWVMRRGVGGDPPETLAERMPIDQWMHSMYFVLTVFTTVGLGTVGGLLEVSGGGRSEGRVGARCSDPRICWGCPGLSREEADQGAVLGRRNIFSGADSESGRKQALRTRNFTNTCASTAPMCARETLRPDVAASWRAAAPLPRRP